MYLCMHNLTPLSASNSVCSSRPSSPESAVFTKDSSLRALPFKLNLAQSRLLGLERSRQYRNGPEASSHPARKLWIPSLDTTFASFRYTRPKIPLWVIDNDFVV